MKDVARELLKVARELIAKARKGDYYVVRKDSSFVDTEDREIDLKKGEIWEIKSTGRVTRLLVLRNRRQTYVDVAEEVLGGIIRNRIFQKVDRDDILPDPSSWTDKMFVEFGKKNVSKIARALLPGLRKAAIEELKKLPSSLLATKMADDRYDIYHGGINSKFSKGISLPVKDVKWPKDIEEVMEFAEKRSNVMGWIIEPAAKNLPVNRITTTQTTKLLVEGEEIRTEFKGTVSLHKAMWGWTITAIWKMDPAKVTAELNRIDAKELSEDQSEIVQDINNGLEEAVATLVDEMEAIEIEDLETSWDGGQQGGYTDPSWDPYIEEITYENEYEKAIPFDELLQRIGIQESWLDDAQMTAREAIRRGMKGVGTIDLVDVMFDFGSGGEHYLDATVSTLVLGPSALEFVVTPGVPDNVDEDIRDKLTENHDPY